MIGRGILLALCLAPLCFSLPTLSDPYGTSEDGLNPALWGLGARNLVTHGWTAGVRGARVSPDPGTTGNGIYAHHPPLPVWLMTIPVALGGWEGWARLFALGCAGISLFLLARLLRRFFEQDVVLVAVAATALSGFLLSEGRLFNTLTIATPLIIALLDLALTRRAPAWASAVAVALVLSSWDGLIAAAVLLPVLMVRSKVRLRFVPSLCATLAAAFVAWHLIDATGGTSELSWQLKWRASGSEFTWPQWLDKQRGFLSAGLGPLTLLLLFAAPAAWAFARRDRNVLVLFALAAAPGLLMELGFRQGAHRHAFWGFNLIIPGAVAIAIGLTLVRARRTAWLALVGLLAVQAGWSLFDSAARQGRERNANALGALIASRPWPWRRVAMLTHYKYHPHVTWYAGAPPDVMLSRAELHAKNLVPGEEVLVDEAHALRLGCRPLAARAASTGGRWVVTTAQTLREACPP